MIRNTVTDTLTQLQGTIMPAIQEDIEINSRDGRFSAHLAAPAQHNGVAVVVLQEIFGVNSNIREIADEFADAGFVAIAPDLYWRQEPGIQLDPGSEDGRARAMDLMKGLDRDQAVGDGIAALATARERIPDIVKSAAVGYCFGGGVAYLMAARGSVDAGIAYYGTGLHTLLDEVSSLPSKLLLHIAEQDHICPPAAQKAIVDALASLGEKATVVIHAGVGHAFARRGGATFDQSAADRANRLTYELLGSLATPE